MRRLIPFNFGTGFRFSCRVLRWGVLPGREVSSLILHSCRLGTIPSLGDCVKPALFCSVTELGTHANLISPRTRTHVRPHV